MLARHGGYAGAAVPPGVRAQGAQHIPGLIPQNPEIARVNLLVSAGNTLALLIVILLLIANLLWVAMK